jgi:hypothetical protein
MAVSDTLKAAWEAVESAELPKEIQAVAFREAVRLLAPDRSVPPAPVGTRHQSNVGANATTASGDNSTGDASPGISEEEIYDRVAAHTGVDRDLLERLIHLDGDTVKISIPGLSLGRNNADRTRTVAQVLTVTRGFGFEEPGTLVDTIRSECERLKVYDQANFATQIKKVNGFVITGNGSARRLRARGAGIEAFAPLVNSLVGGE